MGEKIRDEPTVQSLSTLCIEKIAQTTIISMLDYHPASAMINLICGLLTAVKKSLFSSEGHMSMSYTVDELTKKLPQELLTRIFYLKKKQMQNK